MRFIKQKYVFSVIVMMMLNGCAAALPPGVVQWDINRYEISAVGDRDTTDKELEERVAVKAAKVCNGRSYQFESYAKTVNDQYVDANGFTRKIQHRTQMIKCSVSSFFTESDLEQSE